MGIILRRLLVACLVTAFALSARAEEATVYLRVLSEQSTLKSGPGFSYRSVFRAERGEVFEVIERGTRGYWFRVILPNGTYGWILGDEVHPYEVDPSAGAGGVPLPWLFGPSPLVRGTGQFAFSAGVLGSEGVVIFRPGVLVDPSVGLEAYLGEMIAGDGTTLLYGGNVVVYFAPAFPICPFLTLGGGGATSFPHTDVFTLRGGTLTTLNAGGGLLLSFRKRLTVRVEGRNYTFFDPNFNRNILEVSGGMSIYF